MREITAEPKVQVMVRLPVDLHAKVKTVAHERSISLNRWFVEWTARAIESELSRMESTGEAA
jgi:predicted HicB family RNase H-like nuclease